MNMREETKFLIDSLSKDNIPVKYDNGIIYINYNDYPCLFSVKNFNNKKIRYYSGDRFYGDVDMINNIIVLVYSNLPEEFEYDNVINIVSER